MTQRFDRPEHQVSPFGLRDDWQRLQPLLDKLLDSAPDRRDAVARELSDGVEAVYTTLQDLADECERAYPLLDRPAAEQFASLLATESFPMPELLAGRYRIIRELGHGGMARVYLARDLKHSRDVAVKVLRPEIGMLVGHARFLTEIEIIAQLRHPHIVPLHDSGESGHLLYYVMPYEDGQSVRQRLERDGAVPVAEAIAILRDVCDALVYAHAHGIVHRDIKPDNVLISTNHAVVADFGIARLVTRAVSDADTQTIPGVFVGTPAYMAPEQATPNAEIDHRADLYAFGVLAYELLVGRPPFAGGSADAVLTAHLTQTATPVSELVTAVPLKLDALITRCLAKQPADRWQSGEEILHELDQIGAGGRPPLSTTATTSVRQWRWPLLAAGLGGLAMLGAAAWWRTRDRSDVDRNRVAVVRFRNGTGVDSMDAFGSIIADVVTNGLARAAAVNVAPAAAVMAALAPQGGKPAPNDPPAIARATGAGIIVTGSYFVRGDSLAIQPEIIDVAGDRPLSPIDLITAPVADEQRGVVAVVERVAVALSGHVNPRITRQLAVSRLPMSMAAYREYADALDLYFRGETTQALRHAYQAIRLDSAATSALLLAAQMEWAESGDLAKVDSLLRIVERHKAHLPPYDLAHFDWLRAYLDGDLEGVLGAARRRRDLAGGDAIVQASLRLNRVDEAYALITDVMKRPSTQRHPISWEFLTQILHIRGDYGRELRAARTGVAEMRSAGSEPAVSDVLGFEIRALAALGRVEDIRRSLDELHTRRPTSEVFVSTTRELRWHGHRDAALEIGAIAERWYRDALTRSPERRVRLLLAETLFELERWDDARAAFSALAAEELAAGPTIPARSPGHEHARAESSRAAEHIIPFAYLGIERARRGDVAAANASIDSLVAFDGPYQFGERQYWQAQIAAQLGDCERALAFLREALDKGTSVYDLSRLEAPAFMRVETCPAFRALQDRPR